MFLQLFAQRQKYRLSYRLLVFILICSSFFTLLITAFQLYSDYQSNIAAIDAKFRLVEQSYLEAISSSVYHIDRPQLNILLMGVVSLQDIVYAQIVDRSDPEGLSVHAGDPNTPKNIVRQYSLEITNEFNQLVRFGTLSVSASLEGVYHRLANRTMLILVSNAAKTFLASFCFLLIIQWLITRHLHTMADYADSLSLDKLDKQLILKRRKVEPKNMDELDTVVNSINMLRIRLRNEFLERKRTHEMIIQNEKMKSLGEMSTGIAHEINNPNNFILLNSAILKDSWDKIMPILNRYHEDNGDFNVNGIPFSDLRSHIPKLFDGILEGGEKIKRIVNGMKEYSYPEDASKRTSVSIKSVLESTLILLDNDLKKKKLKVHYERDLFPVWGNFQRLEQVFINLIQNACDALTDSSQQIVISTHNDLMNNSAVITVRDEGSGISKENLARIKAPFFTTKRKYGGTGLGLFICSGIIEEHNGRLAFESMEGEGTVATVTLPMLVDNGF